MNFDFSRGVRPALMPALVPERPPHGATLLSELGQTPAAWMNRPVASEAFHLVNPAGTSSGKSALMTYALFMLYLAGFIRFTVFDRKQDAIQYLVGLMAERSPRSFDSLRYVNIFADAQEPGRIPMNFALADDPAPKELRARALAHLIARSATAGDILAAAVGHRIVGALVTLFTAILYAVHPRKSLLWAIDFLQMPSDGVVRLQALVPDERVRIELQALTFLPPDVKAGVLARLRVLAAWPGIEAQIGAPTCIDFGRLIEHFNVCVDLQTAHAGSDDVVQTFGSLLIEQFGRALLRRPSNPDTIRVLYIDEGLQFPAGIQAVARPLFETARSRGGALWISVQHLRGLRELGPVWDSAVSNVAYWLAGATSADDARTIATEHFGSAADPRAAAFIRELVGLRQRQFALVTRQRVQMFRSADLDFRAMDAARERETDRIRSAKWALSATPLPPPVRLWEVGGPRPLSAIVSAASPTEVPSRRRRSFLG